MLDTGEWVSNRANFESSMNKNKLILCVCIVLVKLIPKEIVYGLVWSIAYWGWVYTLNGVYCC